MSDIDNWNEGYEEAIEAEPALLGWLQEHLNPELSILIACGLLTICAYGIAGGKSVSVKVGPLMLNIA